MRRVGPDYRRIRIIEGGGEPPGVGNTQKNYQPELKYNSLDYK